MLELFRGAPKIWEGGSSGTSGICGRGSDRLEHSAGLHQTERQ